MRVAAGRVRSATARRRLVAALAVSAALPAGRAYALPAAALDNPGQLTPGGLPSNLVPPTAPPAAAPGAEAAPGTTPGTPGLPAPPTTYALQPSSTLPAPGAGLRIQPSIGVQEYFTDNVFQAPTHKQSDFVTGITPALSVTDDTERVQASAVYNPTGLIYARNPSQDTINQNFSGQTTVTLVPDTLFLDARGYVSTVATNGGFAPGNTVLLNRNQRSTVTSFTVSPYAVHRFGDIGTGEIGATLGTTSTSGGQTGFNGFNAFGAPVQGNPNGNTQSIEETAQFTTGSILPRVRDRTLFDASQQTGNVGTQRSTQFLATNRVEYALNRQIALIGELGYENIRYEGIPPLRISDMVWQAGARWDPNPDSSITVTYGHQDGFNSLYVSGYYAVTARTTLYASYTAGLATDQQQIQNNLDLAAIDPYGNLVNSETAGPLFVSNNLLGLNNNLYRIRTLSVNAVTALDRDTVNLYVFRQEQTPVAVATAGQNAQTLTGISGGATWTHALSEVTNANLHADYGTSSGSGGFLGVTAPSSSQAIFDVSASLTHQFTPSLSGLAEYVYTHRTSDLSNQGFVQNLFLVGVQKTF